MKIIEVTILALDSSPGRELAEKIPSAFTRAASRLLQTKIEGRTFDGFIEIEPLPISNDGQYENYCVRIKNPIFNGTQYDMLKASMEDDIIIFDASVEEINGNCDSNYAAAIGTQANLDNILVVSRTRLPRNFPTLRTNIPKIGEEEKENTAKIIREYSNDEIIEWIAGQIQGMCREPSYRGKEKLRLTRLPVPQELKMKIPSIESVSSAIHEVYEKKAEDSLNFINATKSRGAFISYRSEYYDEKEAFENSGFTGEKLAEYIKGRHGDDFPVTIYKKGTVASEFLNEQGRWEIVSLLDRKFRAIDEFWILATDDYWDSWWTRSEIVSLMYIQSSESPLPSRIYWVYGYEKETETIKKKEIYSYFIPKLPEEFHREIARCFANSDPGQQGNENMAHMRKLRNKFIKQLFSFWTMKMVQKLIVPSKTMNEASSQTRFSDFKKSINSHVYDESFTRNHILDDNEHCKNWVKMNDLWEKITTGVENAGNLSDEANLTLKKFLREFLDINSDNSELSENEKREIEKRGFFSVDETDIGEVQANGLKRANGKKIEIEKDVENYHYRWWPLRGGQRSGPNGEIIERIETWKFKESNETNK